MTDREMLDQAVSYLRTHARVPPRHPMWTFIAKVEERIDASIVRPAPIGRAWELLKDAVEHLENHATGSPQHPVWKFMKDARAALAQPEQGDDGTSIMDLAGCAPDYPYPPPAPRTVVAEECEKHTWDGADVPAWTEITIHGHHDIPPEGLTVMPQARGEGGEKT